MTREKDLIMSIKPLHARRTALFTLAVAALGADIAAAHKAIAGFSGLPHRLEKAGTVRSITCYNDSYATRPDATLGAISAFDQPLALILGGSEKHADFGELARQLCLHPTLCRIVLIGTTANRIAAEVEHTAGELNRPAPPLMKADSLENAFALGLEALEQKETPGEKVLLFSPACASFDMFNNYEHRGEVFMQTVREHCA